MNDIINGGQPIADAVPVADIPGPIGPPIREYPPLVAAIMSERDSLAERAKRMRENAEKLEAQVNELSVAIKILLSDSNMCSALETLVQIAKRVKL